ncbi:MAG: hypothetical protein IT167_14960 [Bryobacterales bacterium]|nr:hypothetical protein [Bryobacterales bacterium]
MSGTRTLTYRRSAKGFGASKQRWKEGGLLFRLTGWLSILLCCLASSGAAYQSAAAPPGVRITVEGILRVLHHFGSEKIPQEMVIREVEMHGLALRPTSADLAKLATAGASPRLLEAVRNARVPAPVVVKKKEGRLLVTCEPVDCEVRVNGKPSGSTHAGALSPITLDEGTVSVAAMREDYTTGRAEQAAAIRADAETRVAFRFQPSPAALERTGNALFERMLTALGGRGRFRAAAPVHALGTLQIHSGNAFPVVWKLEVWRSEEQTKYKVERSGKKHEVVRTAAGYKWKKKPKAQDMAALEEALRLLDAGQLNRTLGRVVLGGAKVLSSKLQYADGEEVTLRVSGDAGPLALKLDSALRPKEIQQEPTGLNAALRFLYAGYEGEGAQCRPRRLQVIEPGAEAKGIEVRFDQLEEDMSGNQKRKRGFGRAR